MIHSQTVHILPEETGIYVENDELLNELLFSHAQGSLTFDCLRLFNNIVIQRVSKFLVYNRHEHQEAMMDFCNEKLHRIWHSYKFENSNPFAYFVSVVDNTIKLYFIRNQVQFTSIEEQNERFYNNN